MTIPSSYTDYPQAPSEGLQLVTLCKPLYNEVSERYQVKSLHFDNFSTFLISDFLLHWSGIGGRTEFLFYFQNLALVLLNYLDVDKGIYQWDSTNE